MRAVGQALRRNPHLEAIPCHRVVASDGALRGYAGGLKKKARLLRKEGVEVKNGKVDLRVYRFKLKVLIGS